MSSIFKILLAIICATSFILIIGITIVIKISNSGMIFLKKWIEQIAIAIVIVSIVELILPSGSLKKYIKNVLGIYIVFCIFNPFISNKKIFNFDNLGLDSYFENQTTYQVNEDSMNKRIADLYIKELKKNIENKLEEKDYQLNKCEIDAGLNIKDAKPRNTQNILNNK